MGNLRNSLRERIYSQLDGHCAYCGAEIDIEYFHVDHKNPKSKGGLDSPDNLVPACTDCNLSKGDLSIEDFREKISHAIPTALENSAPLRIAYRISKKKSRSIVVVFYFEKICGGSDGTN